MGRVAVALALICCSRPVAAQQPAFRVDVANPTRDKPQSKLWFAYDTWWAWLPTSDGSSVWCRTPNGWQRQHNLDAGLRGLPGRADVWADADVVRAVLVDGQRLAVVELCYSQPHSRYELAGEAMQFSVRGMLDDQIETATIARDGRGRWWIAYPWQERMWVRATTGATAGQWSEPRALSDAADSDDLCAIFAMKDAVGVAWSDQRHDAIYFRWRQDAAPLDDWDDVEVVDEGNRTADDHLHAVVGRDDTVYLATKNSVDRIGQPQLVLRIRSPEGRWQNLPYAPRTAAEEPSRPIVLIDPEWRRLLLLHTLYGRSSQQRGNNRIGWQSVALSGRLSAELTAPATMLIGPLPGVNNVAGSKLPMTRGKPWIVLASDAKGNVYEGRLDANREE